MSTSIELIALFTGPEVSLAVVTFCILTLAIDSAVRLNRNDEKAGKPDDPYRMERFRNGEPLDPDEHP